jgi:hypothetical protein
MNRKYYYFFYDDGHEFGAVEDFSRNVPKLSGTCILRGEDTPLSQILITGALLNLHVTDFSLVKRV